MAGELCQGPVPALHRLHVPLLPLTSKELLSHCSINISRMGLRGSLGGIREMQNSTIPNCPPVNSTRLNYCYYSKDIEIANINTTQGCRCCSFPPGNILLAAKYYPSLRGVLTGTTPMVANTQRSGDLQGGALQVRMELVKEEKLMKEKLRREFTHSARND